MSRKVRGGIGAGEGIVGFSRGFGWWGAGINTLGWNLWKSLFSTGWEGKVLWISQDMDLSRRGGVGVGKDMKILQAQTQAQTQSHQPNPSVLGVSCGSEDPSVPCTDLIPPAQCGSWVSVMGLKILQFHPSRHRHDLTPSPWVLDV